MMRDAQIVASMRRVIHLVWAVALLISACASPKLAGTELGATDAPDFTLTDGVSGRAVSLSSQRGQVVALTFLYTTCPDVCPLTATRFKAAQADLGGDANRVTFVIGPDGKVLKLIEGKDALDPTLAVDACPIHKKKT